MSKKDKRRNNNWQPCQSISGGKFIPIYEDMIKSEAGKVLIKDAKAFQLYFLMASKYKPIYINKVFISDNVDNISMTQEEAKEYMTKRTFCKCIDKLINLGFIKLIKSGYAERECNIYGLNDMWKLYDTDKFNIKNKWKRICNQELLLKKII